VRPDDTVFLLGVDRTRAKWDVSLLGPNVYQLQGQTAGHALLGLLNQRHGGLVVAGSAIPDLTLAETIRRIRAKPETRAVSILAVTSQDANELPGANVVLPPTMGAATLEAWIAKLKAVPPRVKLYAEVRGDTIDRRPFRGVSRNISATGMRVVSADQVDEGHDLDLWLDLPGSNGLEVLGRVVRHENGTPGVEGSYGIEFLYVPTQTQQAISRVLAGDGAPVRILRGRTWICELLHPSPRGRHWEVEVRRAKGPEQPRERFLTVSGSGPDEALDKARDVARAWMLASGSPSEDTPPPSSSS
jgi:CheY-like chemotaxis protein